MLPIENQLILLFFSIAIHRKAMIWIWKKIELIKTATMISKIGMKNISRSFKGYIQTTDDLNVDVLFNFLQV